MDGVKGRGCDFYILQMPFYIARRWWEFTLDRLCHGSFVYLSFYHLQRNGVDVPLQIVFVSVFRVGWASGGGDAHLDDMRGGYSRIQDHR
jgi:hypothetical protein